MTFMHEKLYLYSMYVLYVLYIVSFFGLYDKSPGYIMLINYYLKLYISIFLIINFNPYSHKTSFSLFDKKIIFSSGIFLLTTTTITEYLLNSINVFSRAFVAP
jgi:hypothetical protein